MSVRGLQCCLFGWVSIWIMNGLSIILHWLRYLCTFSDCYKAFLVLINRRFNKYFLCCNSECLRLCANYFLDSRTNWKSLAVIFCVICTFLIVYAKTKDYYFFLIICYFNKINFLGYNSYIPVHRHKSVWKIFLTF